MGFMNYTKSYQVVQPIKELFCINGTEYGVIVTPLDILCISFMIPWHRNVPLIYTRTLLKLCIGKLLWTIGYILWLGYWMTKKTLTVNENRGTKRVYITYSKNCLTRKIIICKYVIICTFLFSNPQKRFHIKHKFKTKY